jgi:hypothetical protein
MARRARWKPPKCKSDKVAYRTQGKAIYALQIIHGQRVQGASGFDFDEPVGTYKCDCGAWHLTSKPRKGGTTVLRPRGRYEEGPLKSDPPPA